MNCVEKEPSKFMNLAINTGDTLETIPVLKVRTTRQNAKPDPNQRSIRARLLDSGIAHSFFEEFLWIVPVDGRKIDEIDLDETISKYFTKWGDVQVEEIGNFTDDALWYPLGLVMLRDAVRYALWMKFRKNNNIVIYKREVYDKSQIIHSGTFVYAVLGISLERILRVGENNICICPQIVYGCYDSMNRPVEDPYEKQRNIVIASRCNSKEYSRRVDMMIGKTFPLNASLSNKTLSFKSWQHELIVKRKKQKGLEEWF